MPWRNANDAQSGKDYAASQSAFANGDASVTAADLAALKAGPPRSNSPATLPPRAPTPGMSGTEAITASFNTAFGATATKSGDLDRVPPPPTPPPGSEWPTPAAHGGTMTAEQRKAALSAATAANAAARSAASAAPSESAAAAAAALGASGGASSSLQTARSSSPPSEGAAAAAAAEASTPRVFRSSAGGVRSDFDASELRFVRSAGTGSFAQVSICEYRPGPQANGEGSTSSSRSVGRRSVSLRRSSVDSTKSVDSDAGTKDAGFVRVAVKALQPHLGAAAAASLRAEGELLSRLSHPNIVGFVAAGDAEPEGGGAARPFIVQQCIDGGTLKDRVCEQMTRCGKAYGLLTALAWATDVAAGLSYLHSHDPPIAHRDLKLENVLLTRVEATASGKGSNDGGSNYDGSTRSARSARSGGSWAGKPIPTALIADFGLAKPLESTAPNRDDDDTAEEYEKKRKTRNLDPTAMTGSFLYMSPETLKGERYDARADIFSLGVLLYELFSGVITSTVVVGPTFNPRAAEDYARRVSEGFRREISRTVPPTIRQLISDCWAQDPGARPTAGEVHERLTSLETLEEVNEWSRVPGGLGGFGSGGEGQPGCAACSIM